jgi:hypothetical protein
MDAMTLSQLSRLANLQTDDPLVAQVLTMLKAGRPVFLDRPAVEASLGLGDYPPRIQEQFARWFSRIAGYGVALTAAPEKTSAPRAEKRPAPTASAFPAPEVKVLPAITPERELFAEILGDAVPEPHPCVKDPSVACCGSGLCKTLGF